MLLVKHLPQPVLPEIIKFSKCNVGLNGGIVSCKQLDDQQLIAC